MSLALYLVEKPSIILDLLKFCGAGGERGDYRPVCFPHLLPLECNDLWPLAKMLSVSIEGKCPKVDKLTAIDNI